MSRVPWDFAEQGVAHGPVTWDGLQAAIQEGRLSKGGSVWSPGIDEWVPSTDVPWLFITGDAAARLLSASGAQRSEVASSSAPVVTNPPPVGSGPFWVLRSMTRYSPIVRFGLRRTSHGRRAIAAFVDLLVASALGLVTSGIVAAVLDTPGIRPEGGIASPRFLGILAACLVLYHVTLESLIAWTPGKRLMKCVLVDAAGEPPFATRIVARVLVRTFTILSLALLLALGSDLLLTADPQEYTGLGLLTGTLVIGALLAPMLFGERRPLHDRLAGCWLVDEPRASDTAP
jgi:uncharacterized RDD family membrane protein YckC